MTDFDKELENEYDKIIDEGVPTSSSTSLFNDDIATRQSNQDMVDKILSTDEEGMGDLFLDQVHYNYINPSRYLHRKEIRDDYTSGRNEVDEIFEFWKPEVKKAYMSGLPKSSALAFEDVVSVREADYVREAEVNRARIAEEMSMKHGFKSGLLSVADPMLIASMVATGGVGSMVRVASFPGRLAKYNGLILAEELAYEAAMDATVESYEANYAQTGAMALTFGAVLGGASSAYSRMRSRNNVVNTENPTDIDIIKEEVNKTEANVEGKAFKTNNPNTVGNMDITFGQVKAYTVNRLGIITNSMTDNINKIKEIETKIAELNATKIKKEKGVEAQLLEKDLEGLQGTVDDLRTQFKDIEIVPNELDVSKSFQRIKTKLKNENKNVDEIAAREQAIKNVKRSLGNKVSKIQKEIGELEIKIKDNLTGKKVLSSTDESVVRKSIDDKLKEINEIVSTPSEQAIQSRALKALQKLDDGRPNPVEMKKIMDNAAKKERTIKKTQLTKKRNKLAKAELVLEEFIKHGEKITATKQLRKDISNLKKDMETLKVKNDNSKIELKRYKQKLASVKAENDGTFVDTKALQGKLGNSLITEYNDWAKKLDPDEVQMGIHDDNIPPDVTKDGGTIVDNNEYSGKDFAEEITDVVEHGTTGAGNRFKPEFMRTFGAKIVNNKIKAIRELGVIIQTAYRKNADGSQAKNIEGVTLKQSVFTDQMRDRFFRAKSNALDSYRNNGGSLKFDLLNDAFNAKSNNLHLQNDIGLWVRGERDISSFAFSDKAYLELLKDIGDETRKMYEDIYNRGVKSGHEYFDDLQSVDDYITRQYMEDPINEWNLNYDRGDIVVGIKKVIEDAQPNLVGNRVGDKEVSEIFANALWKTLTTNIYGLSEISHLLNGAGGAGKAFEAVLNQMKKQNASKQLIDEMEQAKDFAIKQVESKENKKRRILMNENMPFTVRRLGTGEEVQVKMSDLFLNNNDIMMESYIDKMSGFIIMGEQAKKYGMPQLAKMDFFEKQKVKIKEEMHTIDGDAQNAVDLMVDTLESQIFKRPNKHYDEKSYKIAQLFSSITYALQLGGLPISMAQELSKVSSYNGFKLMLKVVKEESIGKMFKNFAGDYDPKMLADDMEFHFGSQDTYIHNLNVKGGFEQVYTSKGKGVVDKLLYGAASVARKVNRLSGARAMHKWINQVAFKTTLLKFASMAKDKKLFDKTWTEDRLLSSFLDKSDVQKIHNMFNKHGKYTKNGSFQGLDWGKWNMEDPESLAKFSLSLKKAQNHMVQVSNFDELPMWMQHPMMKVTMNLRTFALQELSTTLDFNANFKDLTSVNTMLYTLAAGGLSYYAMVHVNALGRGDADEYREKMLDPRKLMAASIARAGWTMPLVAAIDTVWGVATGGSSSFNGTRSSGNATGGLNSIPIVSVFNNLTSTVQEVGGAITGQDPFSEADAKKAMGLFPGASMLYVKPVVNFLADKIGED